MSSKNNREGHAGIEHEVDLLLCRWPGAAVNMVPVFPELQGDSVASQVSLQIFSILEHDPLRSLIQEVVQTDQKVLSEYTADVRIGGESLPQVHKACFEALR